MKKLFLLIPALVLALVTNAANVTNINNGTPDALRLALHYASDGDVIVMAEGVYEESNSNYIAFDAKNVTVKAADGANVIIKPHVSFTVSGGARAEIQGVKIDASELGSYSHLMYASDDAENNRLILDGCEIYGYTGGKAVIASRGSNKLDSLIINNCKFYNHTTRSCVFFENTENKGLIVTNSNFYNIATGTADFNAGIIDNRNAAAKVRIDHCTFYNVIPMNTDYSCVSKINLSDGIVSNCIFMLPSAQDGVRAMRGVIANNCLTYNYIKDGGGIHSSVTKNNCFQADPLFADAANGDFSLAGNWVTMNLSPARGAATDGSDLGDPRWAVAETLPSTDFASPYVLLGEKSLLSGSFALNEDNYIKSQDKTYAGIAIWKIQAERKCVVNVTLNIAAANTSGHRYEVALYDADNNLVGTALAEPSNSWSAGDKVLGSFEIPAAGNYTIKLTNDCEHSSTIIEGVTFAYEGGAVQAMPGTTAINEAWFSAEGTRADGKIDFPDGTIQDGWVKWNVSFASGATFKVNLTINSNNSKNYTVALQDANGDDVVAPLNKNGGDKGTPVTLEMGEMTVPAGNYILKVTNATQWSDAELISVAFVYEGGAVVNIPAEELVGTEAVLVDAGKLKVSKLANGDLKYGDNGTPLGEYVYWNIHATKSGRMNVTANVVAPSEGDPSGHNFLVELFADLNEAALATTAEPSQTGATGARALPAIDIPAAGDYIVKLTNQTQWSSAILHSLEFEYVGGDRATLPATFDFADGLLSAKAHVTAGELWFNTIGDSDPVGQYANWNVKVDAAGTFLFTMNVSSTNSQSYKISILDGETVVDAFESGSLGSGDKTVKHYFNLAAGNYTVKLENTYSWSQGHVVSLAVTQPSLIVLDEGAETNAVIHDNYRNGTYDIQVIRSIVPGMYNTICLPFDVNSSQTKAIFGSDVELRQLQSATLNGDELSLMFNDEVTSIYRGTPYLIKTSQAVVNPVFTDVEIKEEEGQASVSDAVDFIGTFIKGEVPAGENNLFLGQNDVLYFSQEATPIKGMRAYFHVKGAAAAAAKRARIVTKENTATAIDLVNGEKKALKRIENGQVIIIRDGIRYNVMGVKLQ